LLQPDWEEDLQKIMCGGDTNEDADHIYMMFSATFNKESRRIARQYVSKTALRISVGRFGSTHGNIAQSIVYVEENLKREALYDILFSVPPARTLIFVNSKGKADLIDDYLFNKNLPTTSIHSDRTQREREDAL
jgi:ATP-dependent RNA helicase DDX3X